MIPPFKHGPLPPVPETARLRDDLLGDAALVSHEESRLRLERETLRLRMQRVRQAPFKENIHEHIRGRSHRPNP